MSSPTQIALGLTFVHGTGFRINSSVMVLVETILGVNRVSWQKEFGQDPSL